MEAESRSDQRNLPRQHSAALVTQGFLCGGETATLSGGILHYALLSLALSFTGTKHSYICFARIRRFNEEEHTHVGYVDVEQGRY